MSESHSRSSTEAREQQSTGTFNPAGGPKVTEVQGSDAFGAFKDLATKIVKVPKKEIDEKRSDRA